GMGVPAGVADLDDVAAFVRATTAAGLDFPHCFAQRADEAIVVQRGIFQRRLPHFVDADRRRDYAGDATMGKSLLEMNPRWRNRPVVKRESPSHRGAEYAV